MSLTNYSGTLVEWNATEAVTNGPARRYYPFEASEEYFFEQDYLQLRSSYRELAYDTEHPTERGYFLVKQSTPEDAGGAMCRFTRTYAPVFSPRKEMESYAYTIPGIVNDGATIDLITISSAAVVDGQHVITTSGAHGFSAPTGGSSGTAVVVRFYALEQSSGILFPRAVYREVLAIGGTTSFTVALIQDIGPITWYDCFENYFNRNPRTKVVPSFLQFDYWLPGQSAGVSTFEDIPVLQPTVIVDTTGNEVDSYSGSTTPTASEYREHVHAGAYVVAEPSNIRRWLGNIYERSTRYVRAI